MYTLRQLLVPSTFVLACLFVNPISVRGQFIDLVSRIPQRANAIVILNPEQILGTPIAQKENWREKRESAFAAGVTIMPPQAEQFVMAAQMDFDFMQPLWEVTLMTTSYEPSMPQLAARHGGSIDKLEGRNAAVLPGDAYVVQFGKKMAGALRPANRQNAAHWLREVAANGGRRNSLSPYLKEAVLFAQKGGTPIIMALDLKDAVSPEKVRERAKSFEVLKDSDVNVDQLAEAVASIRGITLGITIRQRIFGKIKVDFNEDISSIGDLAKPILLEALANNSAMINEFQDWKPNVSEKQITIEGNLYQSGMRRLLSLLEPPPELQQSMAQTGGETTTDSQESLARLSSQQYFKSVNSLVEDLRTDAQSDKVKTMSQVGIWWGRYARKIDQLPILNVDPYLTDYGAFVSNALREGEAVLRGVGGKTRVRQLNAPAQYNYYGRWGGYGWYGRGGVAAVEDVKAEQADRTRIRSEERVSGASSAREIVQEIDKATAEVRRAMTQKFQAEF